MLKIKHFGWLILIQINQWLITFELLWFAGDSLIRFDLRLGKCLILKILIAFKGILKIFYEIFILERYFRFSVMRFPSVSGWFPSPTTTVLISEILKQWNWSVLFTCCRFWGGNARKSWQNEENAGKMAGKTARENTAGSGFGGFWISPPHNLALYAWTVSPPLQPQQEDTTGTLSARASCDCMHVLVDFRCWHVRILLYVARWVTWCSGCSSSMIIIAACKTKMGYVV